MTIVVTGEVLLIADNIERLRATTEAMRTIPGHRVGEIEELQAAGDALANDLRRHLMACGVHDARHTLAAWQKIRRD
jgi:hypothetical protein